ncbi:MAG: leucine--tRNA ligase [Candidatus Levybacteria bacterium]|nr:leucine--tRNA ligase [Candidatus Levybacteria bacterium]
MKTKYDHRSIQDKWDKVWKDAKIYQPNLDSAKNPYYVLYMFPYPSAEGLHVGHAFSGTGADVYARFSRMKGKDVFHPMGFDAFGIHSENFAIKINDHPQNLINRATKRFREQFDSLGFSYDWSHTVNTSSPDYYRWTQWLFIQLFKAGLAEKKKAKVNWCPSCKTVLADEQVVAKANSKLQIANREDEERLRVCERCGTEVEMKELEQWFFKITIYADRLLEGLSRIDWTEKVKLAQRNWIGKSEGLLFSAPVKDTKLYIDTFSAHFQAFYADTFVVIAPDHPRLPELLEGIPNKKEIEDFCKMLLDKRVKEKPGEEKEPEGIFTGRYIVDPVGNGNLPIWVANFAIKEYGTGIVKCSAHDERDFAFAKKYGISLKPVLFPSDPKEKAKVQNLQYCYSDMENGILSEPSEFRGKRAGDITSEIIDYAVKKGFAKPISHYHLRDWLISRQRYWGAPIPMIYCQRCADSGKSWFNKEGITSTKSITGIKGRTEMPGWFPVAEEDLPVLLPYVENFRPLGTGTSPLAQDENFVNTTCPNCNGPARRETDVADTFLDSSWYFLRYPVSDFDTVPFPSRNWVARGPVARFHPASARSRLTDIRAVGSPSTPVTPRDSKSIENLKLQIENSGKRTRWLPVPMYIGGAEHSVLHLLYSRFITKVLFDLKFLEFDEPFTKFRAHGLLIKSGAKMSKSKGNVINPDEYVNKYGADTLRCYLMFLGPFDQGGDFRDSGIEGMERFLKRVGRLVENYLASNHHSKAKSASFSANSKIERSVNKTIKGVGDCVESLRYNSALAKIMELVNDLTSANPLKRDSGDSITINHLKTLVILLAPFAPYLAEELWQQLGGSDSVHLQPWPDYDEASLKEDQATIAIQINGKLRATLTISSQQLAVKEEVETQAREDQRVSKYIERKEIKKVIYVPGKILNFVTD